jgi:hypothetical protein
VRFFENEVVFKSSTIPFDDGLRRPPTGRVLADRAEAIRFPAKTLAADEPFA